MSYISEVADLYTSRCGKITILSPMDYAQIAEWEKQEIPLKVVLDSINHIYDKLAETNEPINIDSIEYFRNEVKKNYALWLQKLSCNR